MKQILFVLAFLWLVGSAQGATIYVDKDSGCPCSVNTGDPYCTIASAVFGGAAGDIIRIRNAASAYDEAVTPNASGTLANLIIIEPDTGHTPILTSSGCNSTTGAINIVRGVIRRFKT